MRRPLLLRTCFLLLLLFLQQGSVGATEIKWTPAEDERAQPSYSMEERQMLLQLDQQIAQSPNPQATLQQVAASNGVAVADLQQVLLENRQFFQQQGGGIQVAQRQPLAFAISNTVKSMLLFLWTRSLKNPAISSVVVASLFLAAWMAWNAPRNGMMLPGGSSRPTSILVPPVKYVEATMLDPEWWNPDAVHGVDLSSVSFPSADVWRQVTAAQKQKQRKSKKPGKANEGVQWLKDFPKSPRSNKKLMKAAIVERVANLDGIQQPPSNDSGDTTVFQEILKEQAERLLTVHPRLTEFESPLKIRFVTREQQQQDDDDALDLAVLMMPGLGRWGGVGFVPLVLKPRHHFQDEGDDDEKFRLDASDEDVVLASLQLSTLPGTYWEGQDLHVRILQKGTAGTVVQVALVAAEANKRRKKQRTHQLPKKLVHTILEAVCTSVQTSLETRTRQAFVRQGQSSRFANRARQSAQERRETRATRERQMEEMAADRRRKRYAENPNQGRYRPSGERMRSPNNAVSFK